MVEGGFISKTKEKISEIAVNEIFKREISPSGSLLMSFKLTVGKTSILKTEAYHNEAIITISPFRDDNYILRNYLFHVLPLISNYGDTKDAIKGKTLNSKSLNDLLIPLPPFAEQHRIVSMTEEVLPVVEKYANAQIKLNKLNTEISNKLKKSILQEGIQGRLVPQIAEEGTAQELLEQIRQEKQKLIKEGKLKKSAIQNSVIFKGDDNR